jgi:hypothetical protein
MAESSCGGPAMNRNSRVRALSNGAQVEALRCEVSRPRRPIGRPWPVNAPDRQARDGADACQATNRHRTLHQMAPEFGGRVVSARRAIPRAAQTAAEVADHLRLGMMAACTDRVAACAQRAADMARRQAALAVRLRQMRMCADRRVRRAARREGG